jgi:hypothetical protein
MLFPRNLNLKESREICEKKIETNMYKESKEETENFCVEEGT